jgi:hypothetical protein
MLISSVSRVCDASCLACRYGDPRFLLRSKLDRFNLMGRGGAFMRMPLNVFRPVPKLRLAFCTGFASE